MYGVVRESSLKMSMVCSLQSGDPELTWQIRPFYQVDGNDTHQASHADQAAQSEDARQHELLTGLKLQPPDHEQRHT